MTKNNFVDTTYWQMHTLHKQKQWSSLTFFLPSWHQKAYAFLPPSTAPSFLARWLQPGCTCPDLWSPGFLPLFPAGRGKRKYQRSMYGTSTLVNLLNSLFIAKYRSNCSRLNEKNISFKVCLFSAIFFLFFFFKYTNLKENVICTNTCVSVQAMRTLDACP